MAQSAENPSSRLLTLAGITLVVAILYFTQEVLLPIALAILLSFLLSPLVNRLQRVGLGRGPAVLISVLLAFAVIGAVGWFMTDQLISLTNQLPEYEQPLTKRIRSLRESITGGSGEVGKTISNLGQEIAGKDEATKQSVESNPTRDAGKPPLEVVVRATTANRSPLRILHDYLGPVLGPLETTAIVIIFAIFMLLQREDLRDRLIRLAGTGRVYVTTQAIDEAAHRVSRYLLMQLVVNASYGVVVGAALYFLGIPNAPLWGLLSAILRFVPYVGAWIAAAMPLVLSVALFEGWTRPLLTFGLFLALELLIANAVEPLLYGHSTGISALGILTAATFWTWLWGPIGLVLSMPLTVCVVVLGRYVPQLNFLNVLLSDKPALELGVRFYQRLLAFDDFEANELVGNFLQTGTLDELDETVLLPALSMSERDRTAGLLSDRQLRFVHRIIRDQLRNLPKQLDKTAAGQAVPAGAATEAAAAQPVASRQALHVLCVPVEDAADRLAGQLLSQLLVFRGHQAEAVPNRAGGRAVAGLIGERQPDCVVISALSPGGAVPAQQALERLRASFPHLRLIVGLWNARGALERTQRRLQAAGAELVTPSLTEALDHLQEAAAQIEPAERAQVLPADRPAPV